MRFLWYRLQIWHSAWTKPAGLIRWVMMWLWGPYPDLEGSTELGGAKVEALSAENNIGNSLCMSVVDFKLLMQSV